jgi:transcriptional regulator with XRE-family HTH domain
VPHPVDIHVGQRLRAARLIADLSQTAVGEAVDVSFQQIQKYENGSNRVSASRLYIIAHVLGVEISYFFEGIEDSD